MMQKVGQREIAVSVELISGIDPSLTLRVVILLSLRVRCDAGQYLSQAIGEGPFETEQVREGSCLAG